MKELTLNQKGLRFGILEFVYWAINASFSAFTAAFGLSRGYSQTAVSRIAALYMLSSFISNFLWSSLSDKLRTNKRVFQIGLCIGFMAHIGMWFSGNIIFYAAFYAILGSIISPMGSVLETWFLKSVNYDMKIYGRYRALGSAGFGVCTLVMGFLIRSTGYFIMPIVANMLCVITFSVSSIVKEDRSTFGNEKKGGIKTKDILSIMKIPSYLILVIVLFLIGVSIAPVNSLKIVLLQSVGGNVSTQGIDSFLGCLIQGILFIFGAKLTFIKPYPRLMGCIAFYFIALLNYCFARSVPQVMVSSMIIFSVYSITMMTGREIIRKNIPLAYQTTANGLIDAAYLALASSITLTYAGALSDAVGFNGVIRISTCICSIPLLIVVVLFFKTRKDEA